MTTIISIDEMQAGDNLKTQERGTALADKRSATRDTNPGGSDFSQRIPAQTRATTHPHPRILRGWMKNFLRYIQSPFSPTIQEQASIAQLVERGTSKNFLKPSDMPRSTVRLRMEAQFFA